MIRIITEENFCCLDREIEQAYRRRCRAMAEASGCVSSCFVARVFADVRPTRVSRNRSEGNVRWLRLLESEIAKLAESRDAAATQPRPTPSVRGRRTTTTRAVQRIRSKATAKPRRPAAR